MRIYGDSQKNQEEGRIATAQEIFQDSEAILYNSYAGRNISAAVCQNSQEV